MTFTIKGTGSAVPQAVYTNDDLSEIVDTTDEWIYTRTGIRNRRFCVDEELTDIALKAARNALEDAKIKADELDLIICATMRGEYITPSLGCLLQAGLEASCAAFDINAACSGFVYALDVACSYFSRGSAKNILVVGADAMSRFIDFNDRTTCVLFGDGAGAVVLGRGSDLLSVKITSAGDPGPLMAPNVRGNFPYKSKNAERDLPFLRMTGQDVYKFAVNAMISDLTDVCKAAGISPDEISYIVPHQANIRILDAAVSRLGIDPARCLKNMDSYGNTSAASIPILLDEANRTGTFKKGDLIAMSAFGGGLTTGACIIRWSK